MVLSYHIASPNFLKGFWGVHFCFLTDQVRKFGLEIGKDGSLEGFPGC